MSTLQTPQVPWVRTHALTVALVSTLALVAAVVLLIVLTAAPASISSTGGDADPAGGNASTQLSRRGGPSI